jgi:autotransporter passenger strand-loop-strand repeat protein
VEIINYKIMKNYISLFLFLVFLFSFLGKVYAKCTPIVENGMIVKNERIGNGEGQIVRCGGKAIDVVIESGGNQVVSMGGIVKGATVEQGGLQFIFDNGKVENINVVGGLQMIFGGLSLNANISHNGRQLLSGGKSVNTIVYKDGLQCVFNGVSYKTIVNEGGVQIILCGGLAKDTVVNNGGEQTVHSGRTCNTYLNGGKQTFSTGNIIKNTFVFNGGEQAFLNNMVIDFFVHFKLSDRKYDCNSKNTMNMLINSDVSDGGIIKLPENPETKGIRVMNLMIKKGGKLQEIKQVVGQIDPKK